METELSKEFIVGRLLDYQEALIGRRWQGLLAYLIMNGFLFHALSKVQNENSILLLSLVAFILGMLLIRFVHIVAVHLESIQSRLINEYKFFIIGVPLDGKLTINSVTTIVYLAILSLSFVWVIKIFNINTAIFIIVIIITALNLATIRWKPPIQKVTI